VGCCENERKPSGAIECGEFPTSWEITQIHKKYAPRSYTFRCISHEMPKQQTRAIALTVQETTPETSSYAVWILCFFRINDQRGKSIASKAANSAIWIYLSVITVRKAVTQEIRQHLSVRWIAVRQRANYNSEPSPPQRTPFYDLNPARRN